MTEKSKRTAGAVLLALALLLAVGAGLMWTAADTKAEKNPYNAAFGLEDPPPADHTPSIVLLGIAGVSAVCGVIFTAVSKPDPPLPSKTPVKKPAPNKAAKG